MEIQKKLRFYLSRSAPTLAGHIPIGSCLAAGIDFQKRLQKKSGIDFQDTLFEGC